jgi:4-amino-4-deoxy-L-arabinose transferase-like glycosyltransferase
MTTIVRRLARPRTLLVAALVLFSLWIRLRLLGYADMWWDQSITLNRSLEWLHGGTFPLSSMWSTYDVYNAPLIQYLYAVPLFFYENIIGVTVFIGVANLLGVLAMALAAARVFGWRAACWAALLFVVCPWAAFYGRFIWMQTFVPAFSAMLLASLLLYFADSPKAGYCVAAALCLAAVIQAHLTSIALLLAVAVTGGLFNRRLRLRPLLIGAALFALAFLPFILFQFQTDFQDWHKIRSGLTGAAQVDLESIRWVATLLRAAGAYPGPTVPLALGVGSGPDPHWLDPDQLVIFLVIAGALYAGATAVASWRRGRRQAAAAHLIPLLWLCVPPLVYIRHSHPLAHYYLLQVFPAPFILSALLVDRIYVGLARWLERKKSRLLQQRGRTLALIAFLPLAVVAAYHTRVNVIGQNLRANGDYSKFRMAEVQQVIDSANELMATRPDCQFVCLSEAASFEGSRFGLLREFVGRDRARFSQAGVTFLYPSPCAVYFQGTMSQESESWLNAIAEPLPEYTIVKTGEVWRFYELTREARAGAVASLPLGDPVEQWPNGITLARADYRPLFENRDSEAQLPTSLVITTTWAMGAEFEPDAAPTSPPANPEQYMLSTDGKWMRRIHTGHYLLSEEMALASQFDTVGLDSREWKPGDVFQITVRVPVPEDLPPGRYSLAVALYWYPAVVKLPIETSDLDIATLAWLDWFPDGD